jgi:hypothetical protein
MIETKKIKWIDNNLYYNGIKLNLKLETIQDISAGSITKEEAEKIIYDEYNKQLRVHREKILNDILNENDKKRK